jgi:predicted nucleic acid-binding protein
VGDGKFIVNLSVPLVLEYQSTLCRSGKGCPLSVEEVGDVLDYLCKVGVRHKIYYLWRPFLSDPKDDMVLELAVASDSEFIVTYNLKDFEGSGRFGVKAITPRDLLQKKGII